LRWNVVSDDLPFLSTSGASGYKNEHPAPILSLNNILTYDKPKAIPCIQFYDIKKLSLELVLGSHYKKLFLFRNFFECVYNFFTFVKSAVGAGSVGNFILSAFWTFLRFHWFNCESSALCISSLLCVPLFWY
jgi:hypothetical protein